MVDKAFDRRAWLAQAKRTPKEPAWVGQEICKRPYPKATGNVASCESAHTPHRHCECGNPIDLDHGYCDECFASFLRGAVMSDRQSYLQRETRLKLLEKYGFIIPDLEALLERGIPVDVIRDKDEA
jgi:predicted nucleic acid-binding Zn ribbon protein